MKCNKMSYMKTLSNEQKMYNFFCQIERIEPYYVKFIKRCGYLPPFYYLYTGKIFVVTFVSDSIHNAKGFYLSWEGTYYFNDNMGFQFEHIFYAIYNVSIKLPLSIQS